MRILSWNVNGLRAWSKKPSTLSFVSHKDFDIVCINETRIDSSLVNQASSLFPDFPYKYFSCSNKKGYAGVAILSRIEPICQDTSSELFFNNNGRVITLEFEKFFLVSSYFPNSGGNDEFIDSKMKWDEDFRNYLKEIMSKGKEVVWIGDLNIVSGELDYFQAKGKKVKIDDKELQSFRKFVELGFVDSFRHLNPNLKKYTWFSNKFPQNRINNKGWRIDYAMVTDGALPWVDMSLIHENILGSDHTPIELVLSFSS
ncbi:hypothetical protein SteCoe_14441 [Stentor coeruleus]|uniref:DNA repair nuclease/redox regulator APEX1 n=1 Tax=Stentor coeruleus TaxID=5963 RepID=A0A1R2C632_9CILI|nr:hypothetical protein SteCoe_14441 [Stentor coeruleus]